MTVQTFRSAAYHRRSHSCLAVASHHEHYENPSYQAAPGSGRYYDIVEVSGEGGATTAIGTGAGSSSPTHMRHIPRKSDGTISMTQLQRSLSNAGAAAVAGGDSADGVANVSTGTLGGKLKVNTTITITQLLFFFPQCPNGLGPCCQDKTTSFNPSIMLGTLLSSLHPHPSHIRR